MMPFEKAKWIWVETASKPDSYGEFFDDFVWESESAVCKLSCDGDYVLYINGVVVASNQYGDYEWYKSYDSIDITSYLVPGRNTIGVLVWYPGVDSQRYLAAQAGLLFEVSAQGRVLCASDACTRARYSLTYANGKQKQITYQLGFSFCYDATAEDDWVQSGAGFGNAVVVSKVCNLVARPISKLVLGARTPCHILQNTGCFYQIDFGCEVVGLPVLEFASSVTQKIRVDWGEDLQNGHVRRQIGPRDFCFTYLAKAGENLYSNQMLRLGCRYLEIYSEKPIVLHYAGLISQGYPVQEKAVFFADTQDQKIYDACVNTLKLCMMEHYVDTPWREQCLYTYDSRNQALMGYHAFVDGNAAYARANLKLIGADRRADGLLSICYPCGMDLTIPSFSLYYFLQVQEYLTHTGDLSLAEEVYDKLQSVLSVFIRHRKDGLVCKFEGENHWNFYDWSPQLQGTLRKSEKAEPDLVLNLLFILALQNLREIDAKLGKSFLYQDILAESPACVEKAFYVDEIGAYAQNVTGEGYTVLGNALAILTGVASAKKSARICEKIARGEFEDCSLSMKCFQYDAMLQTDREKWRGYVLDEIRRVYGEMIKDGGNTVWETIEGSAGFHNAGSLCHGWSAIPIYYLKALM